MRRKRVQHKFPCKFTGCADKDCGVKKPFCNHHYRLLPWSMQQELKKARHEGAHKIAALVPACHRAIERSIANGAARRLGRAEEVTA